MANRVGQWEIEKMEGECKLPENLATGLAQVTKEIIGAKYTPVLYCGKQLVNGTNYMLICKQTICNAEGTEQLVKMVLHEDWMRSETERKFSIVAMESLFQ